ncbi:MAG TPA: hypothetical protein DCL61_04955 [Cyanobacteria bacterium UBA12227]|nr:hypothetical protein [Cyanobacteria bacterium UBA12227]HBY80486.1 hypothetical protein [Cyanobacteria bacterium UBA11148]
MVGIDELIANAEKLFLDEQLQLVTKLLERIRQNYALAEKPRPRWSDICGAARYPLVGEDAQAWVLKTRSESDAHRERDLY